MDPQDRKNLLVLASVAVLVGVCLFVLHLMSKNLATERCLEEGRRDCMPIPTDGQ